MKNNMIEKSYYFPFRVLDRRHLYVIANQKFFNLIKSQPEEFPSTSFRPRLISIRTTISSTTMLYTRAPGRFRYILPFAFVLSSCCAHEASQSLQKHRHVVSFAPSVSWEHHAASCFEGTRFSFPARTGD